MLITTGLLFSATVPAHAVTPAALVNTPVVAATAEELPQLGTNTNTLAPETVQEVTIPVKVEEPDLGDLRLEISATTQAELDVIRAEEARIAAEAAAAAEAARQAEAARVAEQARVQQAQAQQQQAQQAQVSSNTRGASQSNGASNSNSRATNVVAAPAAAAQSVPSSGRGSIIANAALGQVGIRQDCVAPVRKALAAAGIAYPSMANLSAIGGVIPASQASPGDIIYYANGGTGSKHVGVYIGGGQAVHGGWSGNNTIIAGLYLPGASSPIVYNVG